ncbi:GMC oxidoreductase [Neolentinus lepideus HHB14362 ss-1]|uniref:GMC oxidoreductase n=1 Tax=Neolentinus lepideus HHB14362 ss-1 TaxID=1314782 RepID=A0A165RC54_9AGAM|nr:GMC oxidoreductase [Neolentinus lepideus HHB14362 ss-1]
MVFRRSKLVCDPSRIGVHDSQSEWPSYDYVIVGGGTAGCVLASRLTEQPGVNVLLVEAGESNQDALNSRMPLAFIKLFHTQYDWDYETTPQVGLNNRRVHWPKGRLLGGSSSINCCVHHHCAPEGTDFDNWVRLGIIGWGYQDLSPYFLKAENYTPASDDTDVDTSLRGTSGPWQTRRCKALPICQAIMHSCEALGIPSSKDFNTNKGTMGVGKFTSFVDRRGERSSTATAYLTSDVLSRTNLTVLIRTSVERIIFDKQEETPRAIGVQLSTSRDASSYVVRASKEVILCAGSVATPQLLSVSGIGPEEELARLGIRSVRSLDAVGKNLSDHMCTGALHFRCKPGFSLDYLSNPLSAAIAAAKWMAAGVGPFADAPMPGAAFFRSDDPNLPFGPPSAGCPVEDLTTGPGAPDCELVWFPAMIRPNEQVELPRGTQGITLSVVALQMKSVGSIALESASIWDKPVIHANYLQHESDVNLLLRMIHLQRAVARTPPLRDLLELSDDVTDKGDMFWPGDAHSSTLTDDALRDWIRANALGVWHPVSTARMGVSEADSVVGVDLRVHGVMGLRVCDASVFPTQVSGHPSATVVAMAEKLADMIKGEQQL